jgi:hypothetical protein
VYLYVRIIFIEKTVIDDKTSIISRIDSIPLLYTNESIFLSLDTTLMEDTLFILAAHGGGGGG